jgi:hypothetical protein
MLQVYDEPDEGKYSPAQGTNNLSVDELPGQAFGAEGMITIQEAGVVENFITHVTQQRVAGVRVEDFYFVGRSARHPAEVQAVLRLYAGNAKKYVYICSSRKAQPRRSQASTATSDTGAQQFCEVISWKENILEIFSHPRDNANF